MSVNKKIHYGDHFGKTVNEEIIEEPIPTPPTGRFTFDSTTITFDSLIRTFDEL